MTTLQSARVDVLAAALRRLRPRPPPRSSRRGPNDVAASGHALACRVQPPDRSRKPAAQEPAVAPVAAVLASADLRVRVERDTARGVFNLTGDVLRAGVSRVSLMSGRDADRGERGGPAGAAHRGRRRRTRRCCPGPARSRSRSNGARRSTFAPGRASFVAPGAAGGNRARDHRSAGRTGRRPSVRRPGHAAIDGRGPDDRGSHARSRARRPRSGGRCATARR